MRVLLGLYRAQRFVLLSGVQRLQVRPVRLGHRRAASLGLLEELLLFSFRFRLFEGAILLGHPVWKSKSHVVLTSSPDALIDFHTAANFSSCARFLASAARFFSFLVYLPAGGSRVDGVETGTGVRPRADTDIRAVEVLDL